MRMYSFAGDTVLDPFLGSGTVMQAARDWGRHSVGIEVNPAFLPLVRERIGKAEKGDKGVLTDKRGNRYLLHGGLWGEE
jgi:DNA modification methylase